MPWSSWLPPIPQRARSDADKAIKFFLFVLTLVLVVTLPFFVEAYRLGVGCTSLVVGLIAFLHIPPAPIGRDDPLWLNQFLLAAYLPNAGGLAGCVEAFLIWFRHSIFDREAARAGLPATANLDMLEIIFLCVTELLNYLYGTAVLLLTIYAVHFLVNRRTSQDDRGEMDVAEEAHVQLPAIVDSPINEETPDVNAPTIDDNRNTEDRAPGPVTFSGLLQDQAAAALATVGEQVVKGEPNIPEVVQARPHNLNRVD